MKKFSIKNTQGIAPGHEDPKNPGTLKRVIFTAEDVKIEGIMQMINWSKMPVGKSLALHYHEFMEEVFIILSGKAEFVIDDEREILEATDAVYVPQQSKHLMKNIGTETLEYLAIGVVTKAGGKTVVVEKAE
ncbi:MAG: cupin domain-containing protein [Candidatus Moraniibacteriota bacterium]